MNFDDRKCKENFLSIARGLCESLVITLDIRISSLNSKYLLANKVREEKGKEIKKRREKRNFNTVEV